MDHEDGKRYVYENDTDTIRKVLESNNIPCELATDDQQAAIAVERSVEVGIPVLAISYAIYRDNKDIIQTAVEKLGDYYIAKAEREIDVTIKIEKQDDNWATFNYKGHPGDMETVLSDIEERLDSDD